MGSAALEGMGAGCKGLRIPGGLDAGRRGHTAVPLRPPPQNLP
jgi:hypothetical protein